MLTMSDDWASYRQRYAKSGWPAAVRRRIRDPASCSLHAQALASYAPPYFEIAFL